MPTRTATWACCYRLFGRTEEAEASYRAAIAINPEHADAYRNLAIVLDQTGRTPEALVAYCKAITIEPRSSSTRRLLAVAYCTIGDFERAVEFCEEWVKAEPDDPMARHTLAACSQRDVPARASDEYVVASFDTFAATFEAKLARLEYKAPALVAASLAETGTPASKQLDVLDAGCGTGWCGPLLAPYARQLKGVDLSSGMLAHAHAKGVYDELTHAELVSYLQGQSGAFDIIVSADTLVYFGSLEPFAAAASDALRPGGWVIFTVEEAAPSTETFHLEVHGRYNHAASYVERVLGAAGLTTHIDRDVLRNESGLPVKGLVVRARKRWEAIVADTPGHVDHDAARRRAAVPRACMAGRRLGRISDFEVSLLSEKPDIDLDGILGKSVTVHLSLPDDSVRHFNGYVTRFSQGGKVGRYYQYHARREPVALVPDPDRRLPHLPGAGRPGHPEEGLRRPHHVRRRVRAHRLLPQVDVLRAVSRDRLQLRQPADGAGGHLLLLPARGREAHDGADRLVGQARGHAGVRDS